MMQRLLLLPTTTRAIRTTVVFLSAADDHVPSSYADRLFIMLTHDKTHSMLVPTPNQKRATSSSLSVEEVEERPVLPTKMVVNWD